MTALWVCLGGGLGATLRLVLDGALRARWPGIGSWATAVINVTGSLVLGLLFGLLTAGDVGTGVEAALGTGVCGGYTTFSTATVETLRLAEQRNFRGAVTYALVSLIASVAACSIGYALVA